eukprot:TRINITY_DN1958_c0_g1_i4.p1 TRINITY_DN1958_c0_g1~~TRINITY_DN1958_c0_g1_i4.p1  ORF type:complete len:226 (+),score=10.03 TRINITY_DN1958_c0_g1_i4:117-794(+)
MLLLEGTQFPLESQAVARDLVRSNQTDGIRNISQGKLISPQKVQMQNITCLVQFSILYSSLKMAQQKTKQSPIEIAPINASQIMKHFNLPPLFKIKKLKQNWEEEKEQQQHLLFKLVSNSGVFPSCSYLNFAFPFGLEQYKAIKAIQTNAIATKNEMVSTIQSIDIPGPLSKQLKNVIMNEIVKLMSIQSNIFLQAIIVINGSAIKVQAITNDTFHAAKNKLKFV